MKKTNIHILFFIIILNLFSINTLASSSTEVYIGVTNIAKSNMKFLIVDEEGAPIDGASIELWANESLEYQLLGVSHSGGIYETSLPYETYPYKVYKVGYEEVKQKVNLPNRENPHIEKVVMKKIKPKDPSKDENTTDVNTGDGTNRWSYILMISASFVIMSTYYFKRNSER